MMYALTKNGKRYGQMQDVSREQALVVFDNVRRSAVNSGYAPIGFRGDQDKMVLVINNGMTYVAEKVKT